MGLYQREIIHKVEKKQEQTEATDEETLIKTPLKCGWQLTILTI